MTAPGELGVSVIRLADQDEVEILHHVLRQVRLVRKVSGFGEVVVKIQDGETQHVSANIVHRLQSASDT